MIVWARIQLLLLVNCCTDISEGVIISPSPKAAVCNGGDELEVTCNTNHNFLTWNVKFIAGNQITRTLSSTIKNPERVEMNSTVFTFSRTSELGSTGLISRLVISPVKKSLNGTKIVCTEVGVSAMMENTTVYIIGNTSDYLNSPEVNVSSEIFGTDDVEVVLDMQTDNSILLNISIGISTETNITINTSSAHFTMPYNTPTNVSVIAHLCGVHISTVIELNYAKCESPLTSGGSGVAVTMGYRDRALEGTNITFTVLPDFYLMDLLWQDVQALDSGFLILGK